MADVKEIMKELAKFQLNKEVGISGFYGEFIPIKGITLSSEGKVLIVPQHLEGETKVNK